MMVEELSEAEALTPSVGVADVAVGNEEREQPLWQTLDRRPGGVSDLNSALS